LHFYINYKPKETITYFLQTVLDSRGLKKGGQMKNLFLVLTAVMTFASSSFAGVLKLEKGPVNLTSSKINVAKGATATVDGKPVTLESVGAGIRTKFVFDVYVANLMMDSASRFVRTSDGALASLENSNTVAMLMSFNHDVGASDVQVNFRNALVLNKVDINKPEIKAFLAAVTKGGDIDKGQSLTMMVHKNSDASEVLTFEDNNGKVTTIKGEKGLTQSIMSIWVGVVTEDRLVTLKNDIIAGKNLN
jgi:hypothetical protein